MSSSASPWRAARAVLLVALLALTGCGEPEPAPEVVERPERPIGPVEPGSEFERAQQLLERGDIPAAIEPLRRAAAQAGQQSQPNQEEIEFLLNQAEAAAREETAEARIAEMRDAAFEAYVERGELSRVPYFDDPRIDAYFRKVLLSKRPQAREIRERRRR